MVRFSSLVNQLGSDLLAALNDPLPDCFLVGWGKILEGFGVAFDLGRLSKILDIINHLRGVHDLIGSVTPHIPPIPAVSLKGVILVPVGAIGPDTK